MKPMHFSCPSWRAEATHAGILRRESNQLQVPFCTYPFEGKAVLAFTPVS